MKFLVGYKFYGTVEIEAKDKEEAKDQFDCQDKDKLRKLTNDYPEIGDVEEK